jgi:membrane protease YdiL (CAAX protease family)
VNQLAEHVGRLVGPVLLDKVPRDHHEPDGAFRRRRIVVSGVTVVGAALLGISLSQRPGSVAFYLFTTAVAATWIIGGLASGPLHLGWTARPPHPGRAAAEPSSPAQRRPVLLPVLVGVAAFAVFGVGALVAREIGPVRAVVRSVLDFATYGSLPLVVLVTLVNGAAEEVFFRGALYAGIGARHPVLISTAVYALATVPTRNPALVFAAVLLGLLLALQRRATGGILAPVLTHVTWSTLMVLLIPPLFA